MARGPKTAKAVLEKAKALIEREGGWTQETFYKEGAFCAIGAVDAAAYGVTYWSRSKATKATEDPVIGSARREAESLLNSVTTSRNGRGVISYNDQYGRTQADIVEVFERAISLAG